ncbi:hypothetical protein L2E82_20573 [Cichorium intybus]|uniref:Uncharacterized protein n=1 Tax=Cichorium intybus TaxID=13427 RepID=A0ACB9DUJ4_CICIN|nr:hypothetical protein L2E82_20573 [Cichorium intybus]
MLGKGKDYGRQTVVGSGGGAARHEEQNGTSGSEYELDQWLDEINNHHMEAPRWCCGDESVSQEEADGDRSRQQRTRQQKKRKRSYDFR